MREFEKANNSCTGFWVIEKFLHFMLKLEYNWVFFMEHIRYYNNHTGKNLFNFNNWTTMFIDTFWRVFYTLYRQLSCKVTITFTPFTSNKGKFFITYLILMGCLRDISELEDDGDLVVSRRGGRGVRGEGTPRANSRR